VGLQATEKICRCETPAISDALRWVPAPRGFDDAVYRCVIYASDGTASVNHVVEQRKGMPR
jgi:hypothetical protein